MRFVNLAGQRFGRYVVRLRATPEEAGKRAGPTYWHCVCDCGNTRVVNAHHLTKGTAQSCGCAKVDEDIADKRFEQQCEDLTGTTSGFLRYVRNVPRKESNTRYRLVECLCACGKTYVLRRASYMDGRAKSCGCDTMTTRLSQLEAKRNRLLEQGGRTCTCCGREKPLSAFQEDRGFYTASCKACRAERKRLQRRIEKTTESQTHAQT